MATVRDIMSTDVECAKIDDTLVTAARKLRDLDVGSLPICGDDNRLAGMVTDRDIVIRCLAEGGDPTTATVGDLTDGGEVVTVGADDTIEEALRTMSDHAVRRLPVIDGTDLVGILTQADIAANLPEESVGDLIQAISGAPSTD